jgi:hypothetical protein
MNRKNIMLPKKGKNLLSLIFSSWATATYLMYSLPHAKLPIWEMVLLSAFIGIAGIFAYGAFCNALLDGETQEETTALMKFGYKAFLLGVILSATLAL